MPLQSLLNASRILLRGISQVFLQGDPRLGLACLLAIAVGAPPLLAGALLGGALGPLLARLLHCADSDIEAGLYGYNAVLIGMLLAFRFAWSPGLVSLVALGCLASVALQRLFLHGLRRRRWLPPYTLGFVLNGWWLVPLGAWLGPSATSDTSPGGPWRLLQLRLERHGGAGGASAGDRRDHLPW
ncbi:urea transporter [Pseudomonas aeruginosa]|uniref:urea transporter n=1 Tax=Pseudomonas aeruginosa TaxID=287 RepID=UPI0027D3F372|nr:urea transporter [Pseudomonas aeruginosa]MDQ4394080.1 urea transporter [Pseudomonas aeruginosa]